MKVNFEQKLRNIQGVDLFELVDTDKKDESGNTIKKKVFFDLKTVCVNSLSASIPNENLDGNEKFKMGELARKIYNSKGETVMDVDDIKLLKDRIGKVYGTVVVYPAYEALDPKEK